MKMLKAYFTCGLSGLSAEHRAAMIALRETLKDCFTMFEFCDPNGLSPREIYRFDIHRNVKEADILIAIVDERATGLGYEMGTAIEVYGKPVLALAHRDAVVSPFVEGIDHPNYMFARYDDMSEIKPKFIEYSKREFKKFPRSQYVVLSTLASYHISPQPTVPRLTSTDPGKALEVARNLLKSESKSRGCAVVICRMEEDAVFNNDRLDVLRDPVVYIGRHYPGGAHAIEEVNSPFFAAAG